MKKDNFFNRLFHKKELMEQQEEYQVFVRIIEVFLELSGNIRKAKTLEKLLCLHRQAWSSGYRSEKIGPDSCGMFRAESIADMKPEEVYLGNIWGLWTFNIPEWEERKEEVIGSNGFGLDPSLRCYDIVMSQYRSVLLSSIKAIYGDTVNRKTLYEDMGYVKKKP